jgi:ubiquitin C-terminal hydrolase
MQAVDLCSLESHDTTVTVVKGLTYSPRFLHRMRIKKLPPVLALHLKRFKVCIF